MVALCADDLLHPNCIKRLVQVLNDHPDAVLAACARTIVDGELAPLHVLRARSSPMTVMTGHALIKECFVWGNRIGEPSAVMFRRVKGSRGFNADYRQLLDLEMWFLLLKQGSGILLYEPLCLIRTHPGQDTHQNFRNGRLMEDTRRLFNEHCKEVEPMLNMFERLIWDLRMALRIARVNALGDQLDASIIKEVFYARTFNLAAGLFKRALRLQERFTSKPHD
jgi:hypothetical protein